MGEIETGRKIIADVRGKRGMMMTGVVDAVGIFVTFVTLDSCIRFVSCTARFSRYRVLIP